MNNAVMEDILEVNLENFQAEVVEKSQQIPVLLEFYADQAEQCVSTSALLKKLVSEYYIYNYYNNVIIMQ